MGQSCTGKSTVADKMKELLEAEVFSGKDYLRMAKNENDAWKLFSNKLIQAAQTEASKGSIIYVITEKEHLNKVNSIHGIRKVKFTASFDVLKTRFSQRMRGNLPEPVERKLLSQYEEWLP